MSTSRTLVACRLPKGEFEGITNSGRDMWRAAAASSLQHALDELRQSDGANLLIYEVGAWPTREFLRLVDCHLQMAQAPRMMLRLSLSPHATRQIVQLLPRLDECAVSVRGLDNVVHDIQELLVHPPELSALPMLLGRIDAALPGRVVAIVVGALIAGRRRTSVTALADACGLAPRTVEWRLSKAGYLTAGQLLAQSHLLHAVWRMEMLGRSSKQAIAEAGFMSQTSLSSLLKRHASLRLRDVKTGEVFFPLLDRFSVALSRVVDQGGR